MQTELLQVTGMTCGGCTSKVTRALKVINGVSDVKVSLAAGEATVQCDERLTSPNHLKSAVKGAAMMWIPPTFLTNLKAKAAAAANSCRWHEGVKANEYE